MSANRYELLATWYLRFNGYFTTPDFTIHPNSKKVGGGTDADVLAVRFRHSKEYQIRYQFERDPALPMDADVEFLICEVKAGRCDINKNTWRDPKRENVEYALRWMGFEREDQRLKLIANEIYQLGAWRSADDKVAVRFLGFGQSSNDELKATFPKIQLVLHSEVASFLRCRFTKGCVQIARQNWDAEIVAFAKLCEQGVSNDELLAWAQPEGVVHSSKSGPEMAQ